MRAHTITTTSRPRRVAGHVVLALALGVCALAIPVSACASPADAPVDGWAPKYIASGSSDSSQPVGGSDYALVSSIAPSASEQSSPSGPGDSSLNGEPTFVSDSPAATGDGFDWPSAAVILTGVFWSYLMVMASIFPDLGSQDLQRFVLYNLAGVIGVIIAAIRGRAMAATLLAGGSVECHTLALRQTVYAGGDHPDCAGGRHGSNGLADTEILAALWLLVGALWSLFALPSFSAQEVGGPAFLLGGARAENAAARSGGKGACGPNGSRRRPPLASACAVRSPMRKGRNHGSCT